jgi:ribulose 1,5-bisphosphate synthetase/thiazole synthase
VTEFDGVIVGGGHNGLACAAHLAGAGLSVAVVERDETAGGGCSCAAGGHPEGSVSATPGSGGANAVAADLGIASRWTPVPEPGWDE